MTKTANVIRNMVVAVIVAGLGVLPCTMVARADIIFDFIGTCTPETLEPSGTVLGCSGTATGVLDLTDAYVFGTDITTADFVSFSYESSDGSLTITSIGTFLPAGGLNADGSIMPRCTNQPPSFAPSALTLMDFS